MKVHVHVISLSYRIRLQGTSFHVSTLPHRRDRVCTCTSGIRSCRVDSPVHTCCCNVACHRFFPLEKQSTIILWIPWIVEFSIPSDFTHRICHLHTFYVGHILRQRMRPCIYMSGNHLHQLRILTDNPWSSTSWCISVLNKWIIRMGSSFTFSVCFFYEISVTLTAFSIDAFLVFRAFSAARFIALTRCASVLVDLVAERAAAVGAVDLRALLLATSVHALLMRTALHAIARVFALTRLTTVHIEHVSR